MENKKGYSGQKGRSRDVALHFRPCASLLIESSALFKALNEEEEINGDQLNETLYIKLEVGHTLKGAIPDTAEIPQIIA